MKQLKLEAVLVTGICPELKSSLKGEPARSPQLPSPCPPFLSQAHLLLCGQVRGIWASAPVPDGQEEL